MEGKRKQARSRTSLISLKGQGVRSALCGVYTREALGCPMVSFGPAMFIASMKSSALALPIALRSALKPSNFRAQFVIDVANFATTENGHETGPQGTDFSIDP